MGYFLDIRVAIVLLPIIFSVAFALFWLSKWGVLDWGNQVFPGVPNIQNDMVMEGNQRAYPVFTVRWLDVNALGIPTVFFLRAIGAMQFMRR